MDEHDLQVRRKILSGLPAYHWLHAVPIEDDAWNIYYATLEGACVRLGATVMLIGDIIVAEMKTHLGEVARIMGRRG